MLRKNFAFNSKWRGKYYAVKQVAPVIAEEANRLVVVTFFLSVSFDQTFLFKRKVWLLFLKGRGKMRIIYDASVDALTIRFIEKQVECEVIRLNDRVAVDIGPGERIVAIEVLDASELITESLWRR